MDPRPDQERNVSLKDWVLGLETFQFFRLACVVVFVLIVLTIVTKGMFFLLIILPAALIAALAGIFTMIFKDIKDLKKRGW